MQNRNRALRLALLMCGLLSIGASGQTESLLILGYDDTGVPADTREVALRVQDGVSFVGRLGTYRYLDMDQAIGAALREWLRLEQSVLRPS